MQATKFSPELNGYVIGKTIGRGTFGKVKMGIHKLTNEPVAIKFLQKEKIKDISDIERVSRELHFLKIVRHPAIAQMYQVIQTPKMIYIVMEFAAGGEYFDYVMDQKIKNQAEAFHYFSQVLSALIYLHRLKISHRDVKPQNMLLDSQNRIKLVDFGLSNMYKAGQKLSTACGSPCYASPEMVKGEDYDPELTDVWSLGIVLYTSVMAKLPFEDQSTNVLYNKIKAGFYVIDKKISPELKDLLSKLINVDPCKRLRLKQILNHPWYAKFQQSHQIQGIQIGYENIPIDNKIVEQMKSLGFQQKRTLKQLENNIKNQCTTTYYLFLKRNFKLGNSSTMDICSDHFRKELITSVFSLKKRRYKSFDEGKLFDNENLEKQLKKSIKNYNSQLKLTYKSNQKPKQNKQNRSSLRKQSLKNIEYMIPQQTKKIDRTKIQNFIRAKAQIAVKNRSIKSQMVRNNSLSISTEKIRKSSKKLNNDAMSSNGKIKLKISNNQEKMNQRIKTDFIAQIYCPTKKKSQKKEAKVSKEKVNRIQFNIDVSNVFWRKKSTTLKQVTSSSSIQNAKVLRRNIHINI